MRSTRSVYVYISGAGTTLDAIINGCKLANVTSVYSSDPNATGLQYAKDANINIQCASNYKSEIDDFCDMMLCVGYPSLIILAGYMRILPPEFLNHVAELDIRVINIHPSLLPKYKGLHTHQRVLDAGDDIHGFTIHEVTDDLDSGPIITQHAFNTDKYDSANELELVVKLREQSVYPKTIDELITHNEATPTIGG